MLEDNTLNISISDSSPLQLLILVIFILSIFIFVINLFLMYQFIVKYVLSYYYTNILNIIIKIFGNKNKLYIETKLQQLVTMNNKYVLVLSLGFILLLLFNLFFLFIISSHLYLNIDDYCLVHTYLNSIRKS